MNRRFTPRQVPIVEAIEPRILFSADLSPLIATSLDQTAEVRTLEAPVVESSTVQTTDTRTAATEIIFIDTRVEEWEKLLAGIDASTGNHSAEIVLLDAATDGIDQITRLLEQRRDVTAIHIISHGDSGVLALGSNNIDSDTLISRSDEFRRWSEALSGDADILIYGCNVAAGTAGEQFVSTLGALTGADIAASDDLTGNANLGGDWALEFATGRIETASAIAAPIQAEWQHQLAITSNGTATSTQTTGALSLTWSHTVNNGTDRMLIVEVAIDGLGAPASSVSYGGVALTQIGRATGNHAVELWALANPTVGTANVVVNFSGNTPAAAGATTYNGVNQDINAWKSSFQGATGFGTTASVTVASSTSDLVLDVQYWWGNPIGGGAGTGQTISWWQSNGLMIGGSSTQAGAASVVMSGSFSSITQWEIAAVSLKAAPNALPVNTVPGPQNTNEDTTLAISGLVVTDTNLSSASLSVGNGILNVSLAGGASISSGTNGSAALTLSGSEAQINAALQTLSYRGNSNFNGSDTLTMISTDSYGASDTDTVAITVNPVNDAPVISFVSGSASYSENSGAVLLATTATVTDIDSPDFNGGALHVSFSANGQAEDRLAINHQGTGTGQIGVSGSNVTYQGVIIGTWTGGTDGNTPLVITFNGNATIVAVQALAQNITYQNVSEAPSTAVRTLSGYVTDGDGGTSNIVTGTLNITPVNDAPAITSNGGGATANLSVAENSTAVTTVTATDVDSATLTYGIGGADAALFSIDASTGVLAFSAPPNFEARTDANGDGVYEVIVTVSDGSLTDTQALSVTVTNVNETPTAIALSNASLPENTNTAAGSVVGNLSASDPDAGDSATYTIVGGADAAVFSVNASQQLVIADGVLNFETKPSYSVTVRVTDAGGLFHDQTFTVSVSDVNEPPVVSGIDLGSINEDGSRTITQADLLAGASDPEGTALVASNLALTSGSGVLTNHGDGTWTFAPAADWNGSVSFSFDVSSGGLTTANTAALTVAPVNDAPTITSNGAGATASVSVAENSSAVTTVTATDVDSATLTYGIGGADAALFSIDANTGALAFSAPTNFEARTDANGDGVYEVTVTVSDGSLSDTQALSVTVTNVNETPTAIALSNASVPENTNTSGGSVVGNLSASDPDAGDSATYTIVGGTDATKFSVNASQQLVIADGILDFERQASYSVTVRVTDAGGLFHDQTFTVSVSDANEAPSFTSVPVTAANEDVAYSYTITTTDPDTGASLSITGTTLPAWLTLTDNGNGTATLAGTPTNAEVGTHSVVLLVSDGSLSANQSFTLTVVNVNDAPSFTSVPVTAVNEDVAYSYTITTTDPDTGATLAISAPTLPAWLTLTDNGNGTATLAGTPTNAEVGSHSVVLQVSDGSLSASQSFTLTVANVNDAPTITSNGAGATASVSVAENSTTVTTVTATDVDSATLTYGIGGADAALFSIDANTGALAFSAPTNFEARTDANGDGVYEVTVTVSDGSLTDSQALSVTVTNVNETPTAIALSNATLPENTNTAAGSVVGNLSASDPDTGDSATYTIVGGTDATKFSVNASQQLVIADGILDFETKASYSVTVRVTDAGGLFHDQTFTVSVSDLNEAPSFTSVPVTAVNEDVAYSYTITTTDPDTGATLAISATTLPAWLTLTDNGNGTATLAGTPTNAEVGSHSVVLQVSDGSLLATQSFTLTVTNVNDAPIVSSVDLGSIYEDGSRTITQAELLAGASDPDGDALTATSLTLTSGAGSLTDNGDGTWTFIPAANWNGSITFSFLVSDGVLSTANTAALTVTPVNDAPLAADATLTATSGQLLQGQLPGATDADGNTVTYAVGTGPTHGSISVATNGSFTYQPATGYVGSDSFSYSVNDGQGGSNSYQLTLNVQPTAIWSGPLTPSNPTPPGDNGTPPPLTEPKPPLPNEPTSRESAPAKPRPPAISTVWTTPFAANNNRVIEDSPGSAPGTPALAAAAEPRTGLGVRLGAVNDPFESWAPDAASLEFLWKPIVRIIGSSGRSSDAGLSFDPGMPGSEHSDAGWQAELTPARVAGVSFSVGVVWWSLRAGGLLASLAASLPAWRGIDVTMIVDDRKMPASAKTKDNR